MPSHSLLLPSYLQTYLPPLPPSLPYLRVPAWWVQGRGGCRAPQTCAPAGGAGRSKCLRRKIFQISLGILLPPTPPSIPCPTSIHLSIYPSIHLSVYPSFASLPLAEARSESLASAFQRGSLPSPTAIRALAVADSPAVRAGVGRLWPGRPDSLRGSLRGLLHRGRIRAPTLAGAARVAGACARGGGTRLRVEGLAARARRSVRSLAHLRGLGGQPLNGSDRVNRDWGRRRRSGALLRGNVGPRRRRAPKKCGVFTQIGRSTRPFSSWSRNSTRMLAAMQRARAAVG